MKKKWSLITTLLIIFLIPQIGSAETKRLVIKYQDREIQALNRQATINIKRELQRLYPHLNINSYSLKKVVVMTKSRDGYGTVQLGVNKKRGKAARVKGHRNDFHKGDRFNFDKIELSNPGGKGHGNWYLHFNGRFKVRKIIVAVEEKPYKSQKLSKHYKNHQKNNKSHNYLADSPYRHNDHTGQRYPNRDLSINLVPRSWGTGWEREKSCSRSSDNTNDGWNYPDSICQARSKASFIAGNSPNILFVRPDIRPLKIYRDSVKIKRIGISVSLNGHGDYGSSLIGIEIGGRRYNKQISYHRGQARAGGSMTISGSWNKWEVEQARIWIKPQHLTEKLTVQNVSIAIKELG